MLYYLVTLLYVLVCLTMMLVVYLQQGKGGDIASAFGGGSSQAAFGARAGATVLSRATTICAVLFMIGALALGIIGRRGPSSVLGGRAPLTQPSLPASAAPKAPARPVAPPSAPTQTPSAPAQAPGAPAPK
jgi:preprotein translocase subunit SecG